MQKCEGKSEIHIVACVLTEMVKRDRQQQTPSFRKTYTKRWQNRLGIHPTLPQMVKAIKESRRELTAIQDNWRNIREISH